MSAAMAEDFRKAADVIRTGGLAKGRFETGDGRHCTLGALAEAYNNGVLTFGLGGSVALLRKMVGGSIPDWNDAPERTADDVITLFEQAAEKLEAEL